MFNYFACILLIAIGIYVFLGAFRQWGFYVNNRKYRRCQEFWGEKKARNIYMISGLIIIILGIVMFFDQIFNFIPSSS